MKKQWGISEQETNLLHDDLYVINELSTGDKQKEAPTKSARPIAIIVDKTPTPEITTFIGKVMSAVNKQKSDFDIITDDSGVEDTTKIVLHFGQTQKDRPDYTATNHLHYTYCTFDEIENIMTNTSLKRKLWECLKTIFN